MFTDMRVGKAVLVSHRRTYLNWPLDEAVKGLETGSGCCQVLASLDDGPTR